MGASVAEIRAPSGGCGFDENVPKGIVPPDAFTPMWLIDDGIECAGSEGAAKLHFTELIDLHRDSRTMPSGFRTRFIDLPKNVPTRSLTAEPYNPVTHITPSGRSRFCLRPLL